MTLIYFIIILGITIFIHEFGHFLFAKKAGVYVYEFSLGMGPRLFKFKRKNDETEYSIRLFPIGGFVQIAGENEEEEHIPKKRQLCNKKFSQKFMTLFAGVLFNFILAFILLFILALINGAPQNTTYVGAISKNYPAYQSGLQTGDQILKINNKKTKTNDQLALELQINQGKVLKVQVKRNNKIYTITMKPKKIESKGEITYKYGFQVQDKIKHGILYSIKYAFLKIFSLINQMWYVIVYLITGKLGLSSLSGPVGIYTVVGTAAKSGFMTLIYLTAFISINVGFINLLPIPAFDGCRILFVIIEKIKGSPVNKNLEGTIHTVGFFLLMALMLLITYNDILKLLR